MSGRHRDWGTKAVGYRARYMLVFWDRHWQRARLVVDLDGFRVQQQELDNPRPWSAV